MHLHPHHSIGQPDGEIMPLAVTLKSIYPALFGRRAMSSFAEHANEGNGGGCSLFAVTSGFLESIQ